jgi:hypothetical protein
MQYSEIAKSMRIHKFEVRRQKLNSFMKIYTTDTLDLYKIRTESLEIMNQAHLLKIEALEILNQNLKNSLTVSTSVNYANTDKPQNTSVIEREIPKRRRGRPRKISVKPGIKKPKITLKIRGKERLPKAISKDVPIESSQNKNQNFIVLWQEPLENWLNKNISEIQYNKSTIKGLTGVLLCLFDKGSATVSSLMEYIGGSAVTIIRYTSILKKMKLLLYLGSRKNGRYVLTTQGRALYMQITKSR